MRRILIAAVLLATLALGACADNSEGEETAGSPSPEPTATAAAERQPTPTVDEAFAATLREHELPLELANGTAIGDPGAPVTLEVYEDFQCPFCLRYTATLEPALMDEYVATGQVRVHFRNFPVLGDESVLAAMGGLCAADQDAFWPYQQALFLAQAEAGQWSDERVNVGRFAPDELTALAEGAGLDGDAFRACLDDGSHLEALNAEIEQARELGLRGTPSFVLNGDPLVDGAPGTIEGWRALLDPLVAGE